jgi:hypothetical protein
MNDEKFECLKYLGKTSEQNRLSFRIRNEFPSSDQAKMLEFDGSWRMSHVF